MLFNLGLRLIDVIVTSIAGLFVLKFVLTLNLGVLKEFNIMKKFFLIKTLIFVTIVQNIIAGILLPKTEVAMKLLLWFELLELDVISYWFYKAFW